jgi:hypothetical protein
LRRCLAIYPCQRHDRGIHSRVSPIIVSFAANPGVEREWRTVRWLPGAGCLLRDSCRLQAILNGF